ncbi:MAG: hypothetical protein ABI641_15870, partial [Caldimonas sp.]
HVDSAFSRTSPRVSRWDQDGAEYVRSNEEWCSRFARRLATLQHSGPGARGLALHEAFEVAQAASLDDYLRALGPERAAEDLHAVDLPLDR